MTFTAPPQVDVDFEGTTYTIKSQQASDDLEFNSEIIKGKKSHF